MAKNQGAPATEVHLNLSDLVVAVAEGLTAWLKTFTNDSDQSRRFVQCDDHIAPSDTARQIRAKSESVRVKICEANRANPLGRVGCGGSRFASVI